MRAKATNRIELPIAAYEAFRDLQRRILTYDIDPEIAQYEAIEILKPYWDHQPDPFENTEIVLKQAVTSTPKAIVV